MKPFYQHEWFGIKFSTFSQLNAKVLPSNSFYNAFYEIFHKKYKAYEELPVKWREDKMVLVRFLQEHLKEKTNVLSIGCGNGFIENELSFLWEGELVAIEPSKNATFWLSKNPKVNVLNGYFPDVLKTKKQFDLAYASCIDYVLDDSNYQQFLQNIHDYPIKEFLLIGIQLEKLTFKSRIKHFLCILGLMNCQFWGYLRTLEEHMLFFKEAGFNEITTGVLDNKSYWIKVQKDIL